MSPRKNTCSSVIPAGTGSHMWSANGTRMASACPPGYCLPKRPPNTARPVVAHWVGSRMRHHSQKPQEIEKGASTRSPFLIWRTAAPTSSTTPMNSWPITMPGSSPVTRP